MAKIRMRSRHPDNMNDKITLIHSDKGNKLRRKLKYIKISLGISVLLNVILAYFRTH